MSSDTHAPEGLRSPNLAIGLKAASQIVGEKAALAMIRDTPLAILEGRAVGVREGGG